ncbi:GNAT family N-acetyltransferase [Rubrivivax pictus]|uniref:GNAT family N-acetyltransferase n=1 Tax=Aquabacterium humicola TaxID=3237377 RepID=UPI002543910C|nr:GNAT family N-acetyltransferase [Rubrivivax pictus]
MRRFDEVRLQTTRLDLRPLQAGDAPALLALFSDPVAMRYWSTPPWTSIEQAQASIAVDLDGLPKGEHLRLGLQSRDDGQLLGTCSLFALHPTSRRGEIGYLLRSDVWGRGLMHEALQALVQFAFGELQLHRLEADIDPRNAASARSLQRLGFTKEGHLRERWIVDGEVSDTALYGLLRSEWPGPAYPQSDGRR